jgi:RNA polymerase sigma factor (sigma-70 family)
MEFDSPSERVLENLVRDFEPRARAIVGFHGIPREEADDLVQETYLTYLRRRAEVRDPQAWLAGTLRRRCLMFWRARRQSWLSFADEEFLDAKGSREREVVDFVALRCDLHKALSRLPDRSRRLLELRYGLGCDNRETAQRLGYRYSGIYTITKRCLAAVARELEGLGYSKS